MRDEIVAFGLLVLALIVIGIGYDASTRSTMAHECAVAIGAPVDAGPGHPVYDQCWQLVTTGEWPE